MDLFGIKKLLTFSYLFKSWPQQTFFFFADVGIILFAHCCSKSNFYFFKSWVEPINLSECQINENFSISISV